MPESEERSIHEPWLMANLSTLLVGAGQLFVGAWRRGAVLLTGELLAIALLFAAMTNAAVSTLIGFLALPALVVLPLYSALDAHRLARAGNPEEFERARLGAKDPWKAVMLNRFLPGLGAFYSGHIGEGLMMLFGAILAVVLDARLPKPGWASAVWSVVVLMWCHRLPKVRRSGQPGLVVPVTLALAASPFLYVDVIAPILRTHVVQAFRVPSESMAPTLLPGDYLTVLKSPNTVPRRGMVIAHLAPSDRSQTFLKRCIAVAGDTIEIRHRRVILNGIPLLEPYVLQLDPSSRSTDERPRDEFGPIVVPAEHCFVLGDNRDNSLDCRFWGPLPNSDIIGSAAKVYWPLARAGVVREWPIRR